jgi:hypothetical protein
MKSDDRWRLPDDTKDLARVFAAAKKEGPQVVSDADGVFSVSYSPRRPRESASEFLASGGPDDE